MTNRVLLDNDVARGESPAGPTFIQLSGAAQTISTTWAAVSVTGTVIKNTFPDGYVPWDGTTIAAAIGDTVERNYDLTLDLEFETPLLLASEVAIELQVLNRSDSSEIARFGRTGFRIDSVLGIPIGGATYNAQYQRVSFFNDPARAYRLMVRTDMGTVSLASCAITYTRCN